ncbi:hypothetical protein DX873_09570 [Flagellimonas nanhaiensis]|uniref:Uncharacterized protein n=2 Tax=Flagellimonas nanhaiensis TaxID=2292706 RepID=A0A371JQ47_9FLAO|nr:hypothetical protein DX873_09570 [Allomuricauda nanhaiensis]
MSCEKEMEPAKETHQLDLLESDSLRMIKLGKKLENPYEIHAFRKAYQKVLDSMNKGALKTGKAFKVKKKDTSEIKPNYVYIRFDPEDDLQENLLREHRKLIFVDYPFEYEDGERYHKENPIKKGERLSFYASIPIGAKYPKSIPHKILQKMYIPEKDSRYSKGKGSERWTMRGQIDDDTDFMNHVIEQAYMDTDNQDLLPEPLSGEKDGGCETCLLGINLRSKWKPSGNVQIYDDNLGTSTTTRNVFSHYEYYDCPDTRKEFHQEGKKFQCKRAVYRKETYTVAGSYVPINGANILIRDTWTLDRAIADAQGNFTHKTVRGRVRYIIKWDRFEFSIRDNTGHIQAEDKGPKLYKRPWNLKINGGRMKYRGQIFQAAMHFYYHDIGGLTRPPTNGFWKTQIKIAAIEKNQGPSSTKMQLGHGTFGIAPHIKIKAYGEPSERVYGRTIHELAHAAHWRVDPISWDNLVEQGYIYNLGNNNPGPAGASARRLMESWATGVEIFLTNKRYRRLGPKSYNYQRTNLQNRRIDNGGVSKFYTTTFYDMSDSFNQRNEYGNAVPMDRVSGLTWRNMEKSLIGSTRWEECREKNIAISGQSSQIRELFDNW